MCTEPGEHPPLPPVRGSVDRHGRTSLRAATGQSAGTALYERAPHTFSSRAREFDEECADARRRVTRFVSRTARTEPEADAERLQQAASTWCASDGPD